MMIYFMALLFFPGTLVHELSHFLTAKLLFVSTGKIELIPYGEGRNIKLGSVMIAKTDFMRNIFIGIAPFFAGTAILLSMLFYLPQNIFENKFLLFLVVYIIFEIGNNMFSSKKDLEGTVEVVLIICGVISIFFLLGFRIPSSIITAFVSFKAPYILNKCNKLLVIPLGIDALVILIMKLLNNFLY